MRSARMPLRNGGEPHWLGGAYPELLRRTLRLPLSKCRRGTRFRKSSSCGSRRGAPGAGRKDVTLQHPSWRGSPVIGRCSRSGRLPFAAHARGAGLEVSLSRLDSLLYVSVPLALRQLRYCTQCAVVRKPNTRATTATAILLFECESRRSNAGKRARRS